MGAVGTVELEVVGVAVEAVGVLDEVQPVRRAAREGEQTGRV